MNELHFSCCACRRVISKGLVEDATAQPVLTAEDRCSKGHWTGDQIKLGVISEKPCPDYVGPKIFR